MNIGDYHPILIHFPIVFLTVALLFDLLGSFSRAKRYAHLSYWCILATLLFLPPVLVTGVFASEQFFAEQYNVSLHMYLAIGLAILVLIQAPLRFLVLSRRAVIPRRYIVFLSVVTSMILILACDAGAFLTWGRDFFIHPVTTVVNYYDLNDALGQQVDPKALEDQMRKRVDVLDVIPIFQKHRCVLCHSSQFVLGVPANFSSKSPSAPIWLPRDTNQNLVDWAKSPFYKSVVFSNRMPLDENNEPVGISWSERLTLLMWLENNAPWQVPTSLSGDSDKTDTFEK